MAPTLAFDAETSGLEDGCSVFVISVCNVDTLDCVSFFAPDSEARTTGHIEEAIAYLGTAERVVSFNGSGFDLRVMAASLSPDSPARARAARIALESYDILFDFTAAHGYYTSLASLCQGSLEKDKSGSGAEAVDWWKAGEHGKVIEYCEDDARLTAELWTAGVGWERLSRKTKRGKIAHWELSGGAFRRVVDSIRAWKQDPPDVSWMDDPSSSPDLRENVRWAVDILRN